MNTNFARLMRLRLYTTPPVPSQARVAEAMMEEEENISPSVPATTSEAKDKITALLDSEVPEFIPPEGFVDEVSEIHIRPQ